MELKPGGAEIDVTDENKHEYAELKAQFRLKRGMQEQTEYFMKGFHDILPKEALKLFDERELEVGGLAAGWMGWGGWTTARSSPSRPRSPFCLRSFLPAQLLLIGLADFDVDEWERCTIYRSYTRKAKQIGWFWEVRLLTLRLPAPEKNVLLLSASLLLTPLPSCPSLIIPPGRARV